MWAYPTSSEKDIKDCKFLFDPLSQGKVCALRAMRYIGVFFIAVQYELPHVIEGKSQAGMQLRRIFHAPLDKPRVHQFPYQ